jgi:hypothetical protein
MIRLFHWLYVRYRNRPDPGLQHVSMRFGAVSKFTGYDEAKAVAGFQRARRQSASGRPYQKSGRKPKSAQVIAIRKGQR